MGRGGRGGGGGSRGSRGGGSRGSRGHVGGGSRGGYRSSSSSRRYPSSRRHTHVYVGGPRYYGTTVQGPKWLGYLILGVFVLIFGTVFLTSVFDWGVTSSTVQREKLSVTSSAKPGYDDELGWIRSADRLERGLDEFYDDTGVVPYLYITDTLADGSHYATVDNLEDTAMAKYDEVFDDEVGLVLLFHEYNSSANYSTWVVTGTAAKTVMDDEAVDILLDYVDSYYYSDMDEDGMFSEAFSDASNRIMRKSVQPMHVVLVVFGGVIAIVVISMSRKWWLEKQKRDAEKARETERILNSDLDSFGETGVDTSDLEKKYTDVTHDE